MNPSRIQRSDLEPLLQHISRKTGLSFPQVRHDEIAAAVGRVMKNHSIHGADHLIARLEADADVFDAIMAEVTVGESYFFRDPAQFEAIRTVILPSLLDNRTSSSPPIRIWSAGCSTGEEAYSVAILMEEEGVGDCAEISATDISRPALRKAQKAEYGPWSLRDNPWNIAERYFYRNERRFRLDERLRQRVSFEFLNLSCGPYPSVANGTAEVDLILCRNVLIYFDKSTVRRTANRLFQCLAEGGWLVIGPSDPPLWDYTPFETVITPGGVLYRRQAGSAGLVRPDRPARKRSPARPSARPPHGPKASMTEPTPPHRKPGTQAAVGLGGHPSLVEPGMAEAGDFALRVRSLCEAGKLAEAEKTASAAVEKHPFSPELHYLQAILFSARNREDEAIAALRRSIYLDRTLVAAYFALGSILQRTDTQAALRAFASARALCSARPSDEVVPLTGDTAGSLAENAQAQIDRLSASHR